MSEGQLVLFGVDSIDLLTLTSRLDLLFAQLGVVGRLRADGPRLHVTVEGAPRCVELCLSALPDWYVRKRRDAALGSAWW